MLFTVGHSTLQESEFLALLHAHGIRHVVDVRRYPGSRRHPHFAREHLSRALRDAGIGYTHEPELGGRRAPAPDSPNTAWRSASFRAYADHMASDEFRDAFQRILNLGAATPTATPTAIMCAEAVPWRCHRQLIADALVARDIPVLNITSPTRAEPHRLNPAAVVAEDGSLTYPAPGPDQPTLF